MIRIGIGYDLHRLAKGRPLILGGVDIPHTKGLIGHSDADGLAHAIIDALLGAAALGNIGQHFPDSEDQFKDADSLLLLKDVVGMVRHAGYAVVNVDANIIAQEPRFGPYIDAMRNNLAACLGVARDRVSVKAKSNERMGPEGRGQAVRTEAVVLIERLDD